MASSPAAAAARSAKLKIAAKLGASLIVPAVPILVWWKSARDRRDDRAESVKTKIRIPNVRTVDEIMIDQIRPGDVVLFDRRCDRCAAGPLAALNCLVGRSILCDETTRQQGRGGMGGGVMSARRGSFDHCGVVVPSGDGRNDAILGDGLLLLEATAGGGIVARPLLHRLEMSQSRSVLLLPLSCPGERRRRVEVVEDGDDDDDVEDEEDHSEESERSLRLRRHIRTHLAKFRNDWVKSSRQTNYGRVHSLVGLSGSVGYALGLQHASPSPVSPSAWLVVSALRSAGVAANVDDRDALEARVEDFLRDHRFAEEDVVRLRPGFKFLSPVAMRETSTSA